MFSQTVVLIGFMGSGKSSVARALAFRTGLPVLDVDAAIEAEAGCPIADLFRERGEEFFRAAETRALQSTLLCDGIVATGGGVVTRSENRALLQEHRHRVVYLRAQAETLAARIRQQPGTRPLIDGKTRLSLPQTIARVQELLSARAPLYEDCAGIVVDTDRRSLDDIAREIAGQLTG